VDQLSLLDPSGDPSEPSGEGNVIVSEAEVRELARVCFGLPPAPALESPLVETRRKLRAYAEGADHRGLVAMWSRTFGYVSIHDPQNGEWCDLGAKDAPGWAKREAFLRKELWRAGNQRAYQLTATEMEEVWEREQAEMWDEPYRPADARDSLIYKDYLEDDD